MRTEIDLVIGTNDICLEEELSIEEVKNYTIEKVKKITGVEDIKFIDIFTPGNSKNYYRVLILIDE